MPSGSEDRPTSPPGSAEDALRRLEQRLDRAQEAAERLMAQAVEAAGGAGSSGGDPAEGAPTGGNPGDGEPVKPPPAGWQVPGDSGGGPELDPFVALVGALRDLVPPELQRRLVAALRELLLALRALIDSYLERMEHRREPSVQVQDIPIL